MTTRHVKKYSISVITNMSVNLSTNSRLTDFFHSIKQRSALTELTMSEINILFIDIASVKCGWAQPITVYKRPGTYWIVLGYVLIEGTTEAEDMWTHHTTLDLMKWTIIGVIVVWLRAKIQRLIWQKSCDDQGTWKFIYWNKNRSNPNQEHEHSSLQWWSSS